MSDPIPTTICPDCPDTGDCRANGCIKEIGMTPTIAQTHQDTLRLILNSDTSPCLYAHEVAALKAAIAALDAIDNRSAETHG